MLYLEGIVMKNQKYDWKEFYQAFAKRLLDFKDDRSDLIDKVKRIYSSTGIKLPTLEYFAILAPPVRRIRPSFRSARPLIRWAAILYSSCGSP
jgi:hypothetical protein